MVTLLSEAMNPQTGRLRSLIDEHQFHEGLIKRADFGAVVGVSEILVAAVEVFEAVVREKGRDACFDDDIVVEGGSVFEA